MTYSILTKFVSQVSDNFVRGIIARNLIVQAYLEYLCTSLSRIPSNEKCLFHYRASNACAFIIFNISIVDLWSLGRGDARASPTDQRSSRAKYWRTSFFLRFTLTSRTCVRANSFRGGEQTLLFRENQDNFVILNLQGSSCVFLFFFLFLLLRKKRILLNLTNRGITSRSSCVID